MRLVNGVFSVTQTLVARQAPGNASSALHDGIWTQRRMPQLTALRGFGFQKLMSVQRITRDLSTSAALRRLRLAASLIVLAVPLSGCGTGPLWDKFLAKDDTFVDEPADKLYNEGLYLMNEKHDAKAANKKFEEVDRQ